MHALHGLHRGDEVRLGADRGVVDHVERGLRDRPALFLAQAHAELALEDVLLLVATRITETVQEHETVELSLGQLERAGLLDGVLRRDDEERRRQAHRLSSEGDLALLHGLEHRALHLRRGAVDFVGEEQVREDRAAVDAEVAGLLIDDFRADDVGRQHVDRELDATEVQGDGLRDGVHEERLRQAGHALQEQVPAGEERDHDALDDDVLADDDLADACPDVGDELVGGLHGRGIRMGAHVLRGRGRDRGRDRGRSVILSAVGGAISRPGS